MTEQAQQLSETSLADFEETTLRRWNWGAFTFTWIWAFGMRLWMWAIGLFLTNAVIYALLMFSIKWSEGASPLLKLSGATIRHLGWLGLLINVAASFWLGAYGNHLAWKGKDRKWDDLLHFRVTQLGWERYGRPIAIAVLTLVPMYFLFSEFSLLQGGDGGHGHQH